MAWRRTLILSIFMGVVLTFAVAWLLATRALDTPRPGRVANNGSPAQWIDIARYDRFGSTDVRCLAASATFGDAASTPLRPEELAPLWMRPMLVPWGWNTKPKSGAFSVRTVKISGWPLPCLYSLYEAVPNPAMWPHKAISGLVMSDSWTGFGVKWAGEMPVAFPYRPRWAPVLVNVLFYGAIWAGLMTLAHKGVRGRRRRRGQCESCRYDLRGLAPGAPCPECGALTSRIVSGASSLRT
jgi:hypothetical protein